MLCILHLGDNANIICVSWNDQSLHDAGKAKGLCFPSKIKNFALVGYCVVCHRFKCKLLEQQNCCMSEKAPSKYLLNWVSAKIHWWMKFAYFEITHKVLLATDGNVRWFSHVVTAVEPANEIAGLRDTEHCRGHAVNCHNVTYILKTWNNVTKCKPWCFFWQSS